MPEKIVQLNEEDINVNTVHSQSPNTKSLQPESIFSRYRF